MDSHTNIETNNLFKTGLDLNSDPLLVKTSILPSPASANPSSLYNPVDAVEIYHLSSLNTTAFPDIRLNGASSDVTNFFTSISTVATTDSKDLLFAPAGNTIDVKDTLLNPGKITNPIAIRDLAISQIQAFLNRSDRFEQFKIAFGQDLDRNKIDLVLGDWQATGNKIPDIEILSPQILGKADGAFDGANNKIYLSSNLVQRGNLSEIVPVIIEEIGHYLDTKIHPGGDAVGDEGEIFSALVRNIAISDAGYESLIQEDDRAEIVINNTQTIVEQSVNPTTVPAQPIHNFAIQAGGIVTFNAKTDLDGNPLDLSDDAFVYAGKGFTLNGNSILPVQRDAAGNALTDANGKLRLIDQALVVAPGYLQSNIGGNNNYTNLNPPQIVAAQTIDIPSFADIKQQELATRIPAGAATTSFNIQQNPIGSATQWAQKFPPGGTATQPTIVRVTNGGLNIPANLNLSNYVIIVDNGDINFSGNGNLNNVVLVANNGNVNLKQIQSENSSILANGKITIDSSAKLGGNTLIANGQGDITFNAATTGTSSIQNLHVVSQGRITFNSKATVRGDFRSVGTFSANDKADIYGTVASQQDVVFNTNSTFTYNDTVAPTITAKLALDAGSNNSDKITNNSTIAGKIADASPIATLTAGFDTTPAANWLNVTASLQADGTFTFTPAQLNQIYGGTLTDGTHTLHLRATDNKGNQSSFDYSFTLDTTVATPSLQLAATSDTGASNSDKITSINTPIVTGTGDIGATIKVTDGNVIVGQTTVGNDGTWQVATSTLTNGNHSLIATATDLAGNISASAPLSLVIDTLAPQLTLTTPIDTNPLKNNAKLLGTINGTGSNLTSINYRWDSSTTSIAINPNANGGFDQQLDFTEISNGVHIITIAATDLAGNVTTTNYNVTVAIDKIAPVIAAQLVADTGSGNSDKITFNPTITGTIADANQIAEFKASFDGINYVSILSQQQADGTFTLDKTQLEIIAGRSLVDGNYTLHLIATDEFGNASQNYDLAFTLDTTITVPGNLKLAVSSDTGTSDSDNITSINTPIVTGTGDIGAIIKISNGNTVVGQTTVGNDGTWQIATSPLTNGTHSLTATATDLAGNISTASTPLNIVIDALAPELTLTTPIDTAPLKNNAKLLGTIDATGSNLVDINYYWDNSANSIQITANPSGGFDQLLDFTGINNGNHTLTITATDLAGSILTSTYNVTVDLDKTAPIVNLQLASDTGISASDLITNNPTITGKVTEPSGVSAVTVSLNADFTNSVNITASLQPDGSFSLDKTALTQLNDGQLPDGNYQLYIRAVDNYGNATAPQNLAFQLLTQATAPTNLQLQAGSDTGVSNSDKITNTNQPTIQGNGKAGDTIQLFEGNVLLGQTTVGNDGTWQIASTTLTDGTHNLTAQTIDRAGNISLNSNGLSINIDTVIPNLQLAQSLAGVVLTGASRLAGQVTDTNIATISYQFDGAPAITLPQGTQFDTPFDFTGINDGGHNLTVTATDIAGNSVAHTYGVTVARGTLLTIALLNDTGASNTDGITSDINVRGQVADRTQISRLEFSLDGNANYTDLTAALQLDGTFRLLPAQLNSLAGGTLNLGTHSLNVRGVLADGTPIATATLDFTYQTANLNRPSLLLTKASDTGVIGDLVTSAVSVDLIAKAASGSSITLGNRTLVADINGVATFTGVNLNLGGNNFTLTTTNANGEVATSTTNITRTNPDDVILTWNHIALAAIQRENTPPPAAARVLGMVHTAMYDAVNAIEQKYGVYRVDASAPTGASEIAAAAQAAAKILLAIYPNQQAYFNAALESSLLDGATAAASAAGVALGDAVAANILAWRQQDGSRNPAAYNPSTEIGAWQPDLPNYDGALLPQWGQVTTFGLNSGSQFRPAGDPSLTSAEYTQAFNETKDYGARDSTLRTADETQSVLFWADGNGTYTPAGHWNDIAATSASIAGKGILDNARIFAQLNIALADAGIAAWDAKYTYNSWRPITAIRQADKDGNSNTTADANWLPFLNTPPFPEYVSGHSTFSGAASAVLTNAFGNNFSFNSGSTGLPDLTRSFTSFEAAALEAGQSRIYGGIHFQFSNRDGLALGNQIGNYIATNLLADNSLNPIQVNLTTDTAAFGTTNRDRITNQAGITGKINLTQPNLKLQVGQANGTFVDITNTLDANGNFQLDATKLATIVGTLSDRSYQLTFKLLDSNGVLVGSNNFNFTLDTTAAQTTLNPLTGTVTPTAHLTGTATDGNGGTSGRFKIDGGTWTSFSVQPNGSFDKVINAQGLTAGSHTVNVELADLAGNVTAQSVSFNVDNNNIYASPATNPGWGRVFGTGFSLAEGNSLVTQNSITVALGGSGKRTLDFDLATTFDKSDLKSFGKDRVAVYLVDNNNQPIALDATHPGGVPLFSLSETGAEIIPGLVKFDGTHVQIDVSNVAGTSGKLVFQLLNQDGDSGSNLTVTNFVDSIDPNGNPGTSVSPAIAPVTPGAAKILDSYMATSSAQILLSNVSLDQATGKYTADLRVQNVGTTTLSQNLAVLLTGLPAGVTVANSSGIHPAGSAYLNFDTAIQPGGLAGGAISDALRVVIDDPTLVAFSFKPVVLQGAMAALPDLSSLSILTVKVGDKIDIPLTGELAIKTGTKLPTGKITGDSHLVFTPAPDQVGSYTFTLIARNGSTEVTQNVTLNVVADPITTTRVTGIIADTNQAGLAGVLVELAGYQATTDAAGKFTIILPESSAGDTLKVYGQRIQGGGITYPFIAEKMGLLLGHDIYRGTNNQIDRPIYLPTIDVSTGTTVNPGAQTFVTNPNLAGAKVTVDAGSLFDKSGNAFAGILTITEVPVSLTPAALPENLHPDLVVTIQPGDMVFNTPARLTLPNLAGLLPCLELDLWSINPNTGEFDKVGRGKVSNDGTVIETISGGIRNSSWHFFGPQPEFEPEPPEPDDDDACENPDFKSKASSKTGAVSDDLSLVTYQSQGISKGVNLHYDSLRANPNRIFNVSGKISSPLIGLDYFTAKISIVANGIKQTFPGLTSSQSVGINGGERILRVNGGRIDTGIQADLSHLQSGAYQFELVTGIRGLRTVNNRNQLFGTTDTQTDRVIVVNDSDSVFGGGWNVSGLQKLIVNEDNSALLIDGNGGRWLFEPPTNNIYQSPIKDFSKLERLADGTFQRTTKDGTRYLFNAQGLMVNATDIQGNTTQHIYNGLGQIQQIVDPVGLTTTFNYTGNRVTSIVDPAGRTTKLEYDSQGNLVSVIDPNGSKNQYGYDSDHQVTSSTDKTGQVKTGTYDEFGRAKTATREDGTIVEINPVQVQGLLNRQQTTNLDNIIAIEKLSANSVSTYIDANGRVTSTTLTEDGHALARIDEIGVRERNTYNDQNLVASRTDGRGNTIKYEYDERGNVIRTSEEIAGAVTENTDGNLFEDGIRVVTQTGLEFLDNSGYYDSPVFADIPRVIGDIDNDGFNDIIVRNRTQNYNILMGDADGLFSTRFSIPANAFGQINVINQLDLTDIDADGDLDLIANLPIDGGGGYGGGYGAQVFAAASLLQDPVLVYLNQGNGQFNTPVVLPLQAKSDGFVTGDFNGDGKLDIIVRSDISSARINNVYPLVLYTGNGQGGWSQSDVNITGIDANSSFVGGLQMSAIDVDKDGRTELVFNQPGGLSIYKYVNPCVWLKTDSYATNFNTSRYRMTTGDVNHDGLTDIVTIGSEEMNMFLGQTNGSFQVKQVNPFDNDLVFNYNNSRLQIVDVNGDGKSDLAVFGTDNNNRQSVKVYTLNAAEDVIQLGNTTKVDDYNTINGVESYTKIDRLADINGDGTVELLLLVQNPANYGYDLGVIDNRSIVRETITLTKSYAYDPKFNKLTSATDELGRKTLYDLDSNTGNVLKTTRVIGQLDSTSGETNDVITSYTYTSSGQLDIITDALGRLTDYDYDVYGNLVKTISAKGTIDEAVEQYQYDLAGNQTASIDALERKTNYIYNSTNMLLQSIDALGGTTTYNYDKMGHQTSLTDALGRVTKMTYDSRGRLVGTTDANNGTSTNAYDNNGNLRSVSDSLGRVTQYQYDARNRLIGTIGADGGTTSTKYDLNDNLTGSKDSLGHTTQQFYDSRNRLSRAVDAEGNQTTYSYDVGNQLIAIKDAKGHITSYQYDELGRQISTTDALGHVTRTEYDKLGNVVAAVDANSNRTEYSYDALNRRVSVKDANSGITTTSYDKVGNVLGVTDALLRTTSYNYDALDRQISLTDALGHTSTSVYNAVGNIISTTDALNRTTSYSYDNLNRRIATIDALNQTQSVTYDKIGNVLSATDELGHVTNYGYDSLDRQTTITDPLGHISSTSYDTEGNVTSSTDSLGNITRYLYDNANRQVRVIDAKLGVTKTSYDAVGNVASITDSVNNTTTYTYDAVDRLITDTNQLNKTRTRSYDNVGNLTQTVDRNGRKVAYNYDTLNRQTAERWLDGSNATIKTFSSSYDAVGHLLSATNSDSSYSYSYDAVDRVTSIDNTGTVGVPAVKFNYGYDAVGNLIAVNDSINGINAGITGYTYDLLNRVTKLTQAGTGVQSKRVDMVYNAVNQLTGLSRYSGVNPVVDTSYTYDLNQRLIQLSHQKGASTVASFDYSYDAADKLASTVSSVDGASSYSYDATNQLTGASHSSQTNEAYSYDSNGNRTSGGSVTSANNQLLNDGTYSYTYDDEGNRTRRTEIATSKVTEYVWDYRNRLASVLFKDALGSVTKTIDYLYDGNNQRIGKRIDGAVTERYVLDRNQIALVFDGVGSQTHRYLYGTQIDQVLADETPTSTNWFLADNQGSIRDVVDGNGSLIDHVVYDSFGKVQSQSNASYDLRYGYTGREQDAETGYYYYRARYYDSAVGRFISEDPIGFGAGDTNLTRYTRNSPTNYTDPSGHYSRNLQVLLSLTKESSSGRVREYQTESQNYPIALTLATNWFYLITVDYARDKSININPYKRPETPEWILYAPLRNTSSRKHGGNANLRPGGHSGRYPTIDLLPDLARKQHNTPNYTQIKEIKFKYKGKPDDKTECPILFPNPEPKLPNVLPEKETQQKPAFNPTTNPQRSRSNDNDNSWWWTIPFGILEILKEISGDGQRG